MEQAAAADAHRFAVENLARGDAERAIAWQSAQAFHAKRACEDMEQEKRVSVASLRLLPSTNSAEPAARNSTRGSGGATVGHAPPQFMGCAFAAEAWDLVW